MYFSSSRKVNFAVTTILLLLSFENLKAQEKVDSAHTIAFSIGEIKELFSTALNENRIVNIYLPEGYSKDDTTTYPVIYLLDGSRDEDFIHVSGLVQFMSMDYVEVLSPSIVVGIGNIDRRKDFTFPTHVQQDLADYPTTGHSENFIAFIENELQPFMKKNYRTGISKTIIGQSLGGLLATEILMKKPHLFDQYIIVSPSLWWDNESLLRSIPSMDSQKMSGVENVFIAVGNEGKQMIRDSKQLANSLRKMCKATSNVNILYLAKENHATILHEALYRAFIAFHKN